MNYLFFLRFFDIKKKQTKSILMDATMNVKITDLGFAAQLREDESLYDLFGTPGMIDR